MRAWYRTTVGGLPAAFWYLWTGILIDFTGGFAMLFLSLYLAGPRGLTPALAGAAVGTYGVGGTLGVLLSGVLADHWGRRTTLLTMHLAAACCMVGLGLSRQLPLIITFAVLLGVSQATMPAFITAIIDVVPEPDRPRALTLQYWAYTCGVALASLLTGVLAEVSFGLLFCFNTGTALVVAGIIFRWVPETRVRPAPVRPAQVPRVRPVHPPRVRRLDITAGRRSAAAAIRRLGLHTVLADRIFVVFVGLTFALALLNAQSPAILPLAMRGDGLRPSAYGAVYAYSCALILLGQLFVPKLVGNWSKAKVLAIANGLLALGYGSVAGADNFGEYLTAATIWTVGGMLATTANVVLQAELAPQRLCGRYQSVFYLVFPLASFVAPALGGLTLQYLGGWHWALCALVGLLAAGGHLLAGPARQRRAAERAQASARTGAAEADEAPGPDEVAGAASQYPGLAAA